MGVMGALTVLNDEYHILTLLVTIQFVTIIIFPQLKLYIGGQSREQSRGLAPYLRLTWTGRLRPSIEPAI